MDRLKVDQTVLHAQDGYIFVTNINIPSVELSNPTLKERIYRLVESEYTANIEVYFEISAAYTLIHRETGHTRLWVGSFSPLQVFALSPILLFREDFSNIFDPLLDLNFLTQKLTNIFPDSEWVVDSVQSLIVNLQGLVPLQHLRLIQRNLYNGRRKTRRHVSFDLP